MDGGGGGAQFLLGSYLPLQLGRAMGPEIRTVSPHPPAGGEDSEDLGEHGWSHKLGGVWSS